MAAEIVKYRRWGGMAGISQHMTVREDGAVSLRDRKTGKGTEAQAGDTEIADLHAAIDSVPSHRWHGLGGAIARRMLPQPHQSMRFEISCGPRRIGGASGSIEDDLAPLLAALDELLARAVRAGRD